MNTEKNFMLVIFIEHIQKQIFHLAFLYMKRYLYHGKKIAVFKQFFGNEFALLHY